TVATQDPRFDPISCWRRAEGRQVFPPSPGQVTVSKVVPHPGIPQLEGDPSQSVRSPEELHFPASASGATTTPRVPLGSGINPSVTAQCLRSALSAATRHTPSPPIPKSPGIRRKWQRDWAKVKKENVLRNLSDKAFDRPICEALLDQRFFNGIGNYLRAEILYRLRIPPFEKARTVLEALQHHRPSPEMTLSQKIRAKLQNPDLLELCHSVPKEVVQLGGKGYGPEHGEEDFAAFRAWLRCYGMPGMSSLRDRHGRTIWFQGDPGPLAPKGGKSRKKKSQETQLRPKEKLEDLPPPNKAPSRTPRARRHLPKKTAIQQPEGTSLQQDLKAPTVPEKGRRKGKQATTEHLGPWKNKADNPSKGSGRTSAS
uniref:Nei like DNA glycosylase 1 n=1 Tax=Marmota marmota marmota TaxID=9994 RepID=A0A8C5YRH1_MARMA